MKKLILAALLCGLPLYAQTTTYTGTVKDLTGATVTNGRITWQLNAPSGGNIPGTGAFVSSTVSCLISAAGHPVASSDGASACVIQNNTALTPTGTSYQICIQPQYVTPGSCYTTFATGGTVDISTLVPTPATQPDYGVASIGAANTWSGPQIFASVPSFNGSIWVDGITYPKTAAGVQSAINAAPLGGTVYLPSGTFTFGVTDSCINIVHPIHVIGMGPGTVISVAAGVSATTDIFCVTPTSNLPGYRLADFTVTPVSGTPARHLFNLSGASGEILHLSIERVRMTGQLGGDAILATGSGLAQGTPVLSDFAHNQLYGPIVLSNCGDTVRIRDNNLTGTGSMDVTFIAAASTFILSGNNISLNGGIRIRNGISPQIIENEIETMGGFTGSNGAVLDLDGSVAQILGPIVARNSFQVVNGITANGIRLNSVGYPNVLANSFERGATTSKDIAITASSISARIGMNQWLSGGPITSEISDGGTDTSFFDLSGGYTTAAGILAGAGIKGGYVAANTGGGAGAGFQIYSGSTYTTVLSGDGASTYLAPQVAGNRIYLGPVTSFADSSGNHVAASYMIGANTVLPSTLTGVNGSGDTKTQLSDGTGTNGNFVKFDANKGTSDSGLPVTSVPQKVNTCGTTTTCSNTLQTSPRIVWGTVTLSTGAATVTGLTAFASTTSFVCVGGDVTSAAAVKITNASTSSITFAGTGTDVINYECVGN